MKKLDLIRYLLIVLLFCACAKQEVAMDAMEPSAPGPEPSPVVTEETLVADARAALVAKDDRKAYELYDTYLRQFPLGLYADEVLMQKGVIAETRGEPNRALFDFRQLVNNYPQSPWALDAQQKILEILFDQREYEGVIDQADKALKRTKDNFRRVGIYRILGETYMLQESYRAAIRAYGEGYNLAEGDEKETIALKLEYAAQRMSTDDLRTIVDTLDLGKAQGDILFLFGSRLMSEAQYPDARDVFSRLVDDYPDHPMAPMALENMDDLESMAVEHHTIGCLLPLSGPYAQFGSKALEGVELALHQFTRGDGRPSVKLVVKDTAGDAYQAEKAFQVLADAGVTAIIGPMVTADTIAPEAQALGIPLITLTQKENVPQKGDYIFRNFITPRNQTQALVTYGIKQLGVKRFAILYPSEKYGITFMHAFWDQVLAHGGEVTRIEAYGPDQTDFAHAIKKLIKGSVPLGNGKSRPVIDFEAIFIPDGAEKAGLVIPQLSYHDIDNVHLLGTNLWYSPRFIDIARQFVQGCIFPVSFFPDAASWRITGFVDEFISIFGSKPGFLEAVAYDTAMILFGILTRDETTYRSMIRDALLDLTDYPGVTGITTFNNTGDVEKKMVLLSIKGEQFIELEP